MGGRRSARNTKQRSEDFIQLATVALHYLIDCGFDLCNLKDILELLQIIVANTYAPVEII